MLRVISGSARNLKLMTPEGLDTRPTTDRIKETLFNMLQWDIPGTVVIDFFAGSGSIGIESLSRGAKHAYFVDNSREALNCIERNVKHTGFSDRATVLSTDCIRAASLINEKHVDIVFMDPPYNTGLDKTLALSLLAKPYINEDTLFVIEADINTDFSDLTENGFSLEKEKRYKTNKHVFLRPVLKERN
ncbi:MAG: 16S rRNA (guanine(966)-N(2))-methyltransferase RsmD [Lachnospiraceae bacterium]|nr:16S rRNA (guanine(966)-N(2))-methyltransferase RsmD [Lachnospiraceae bacterium]